MAEGLCEETAILTTHPTRFGHHKNLLPVFVHPRYLVTIMYDVLLKLILYLYNFILVSLKWLSKRLIHVARF